MKKKLSKALSAAVAALKAQNMTLATAESCTGGMIAKLITDLSGVSSVFEGAVVSYSNEVKKRVLGVREETLSLYGAVSEQTAREMCLGARRITGADIAVSTTGIAGPTGGTSTKPVGTVCFGIAFKDECRTFTMHFGETLSRDEIRCCACEFALSLISERLSG